MSDPRRKWFNDEQIAAMDDAMPTNDTPAPRPAFDADGEGIIYVGPEIPGAAPAPRVVGGEPPTCPTCDGPEQGTVHAYFCPDGFHEERALPEGQEAPREEQLRADREEFRKTQEMSGKASRATMESLRRASPEGRDTGGGMTDRCEFSVVASAYLSRIVCDRERGHDGAHVFPFNPQAAVSETRSSGLPVGGAEPDDTARLDWLENVDGAFANIDRISSVGGRFNGLASLREAIDAARLTRSPRPDREPRT